MVKLFAIIVLLEYYFLLVYSRKRHSKDCIIRLASKPVDISILNKTDGYDVFSKNNTYILNICGPAVRCKNSNVSACILNQEGQIEVIGLSNNFDVEKTKLKYKYKNKVTIIEFKCNRHVKALLEHESHFIQKDINKFTFHTYIVCEKIDLKCKTYDVENNLEYDITSLYKSKSNWVVRNVSDNSNIYLNLCGNLHHILDLRNKDCDDKDTQVCLIDKNRKSINLGVFPTPLQVTDNGLSVNFTGGSLCGIFSTVVTKIDFICSFNDSGPILLHSSNCEYYITWHTPIACPYKMSIHEDCIVQNKRLTIPKDKKQHLSSRITLKYNICGVLEDSCNKRMNVSVCLISDGQEIILGTSNNTVISKDAVTYMNLTGELCDSGNIHRSANIEFRCDYTKNKPEQILISKTNLCSAIIIVFTPIVCGQLDLDTNCTLAVDDSHHYDLSSLILKNRNYEITDKNNNNLVYLLNVCQPIVLSSNSFCAMGSSVCLRNNAEPNKFKRFKTLGYYTSSEIQREDKKLSLHYGGEVCSDLSTRSENEVVIEFQCDPLELGIELSKTNCKYIFVWKTPQACLKESLENSTTVNELNDANFASVTNHVDGARNEISTTDTIILKNLQSSFEQTVDSTEKILSNNIDKNTDKITSSNSMNKNEEANLEEKIDTVESKDEEVKSNPDSAIANIPPRNIIAINIPIDVPNVRGIFIKNCALRDHFSKYHEFDMSGLPGIAHVLSKSGKQYFINICSQQSQNLCKTITCLNYVANITLEKEFVAINLTGNIKCDKRPYNSILLLKCSNEYKQPYVIQEDECSVHLEWENEAACAFVTPNDINTEHHHTNNSGKIIGSTLAAIIITGICGAGLYYIRIIRRRRLINSSMQLVGCEYSKVKDSTKIV